MTKQGLIKYKGEEYLVSVIHKTEDIEGYIIEIFPLLEKGVSKEGVYWYRTEDFNNAHSKFTNILSYPENYVSKKAIADYTEYREVLYHQ